MLKLYSDRRLDLPRAGHSRRLLKDREAVARLSERAARCLGTGRYLTIQTIVVAVWIALNVAGLTWRFDPYPFILLNLVFSAQAAYAAPLILFAQHRQTDRDKVALGEDRNHAESTKAVTELLARELAAVTVTVGEAVTRDYLRGELERLATSLPAQPNARTRRT
jgi:uncharacterized membrane protein